MSSWERAELNTSSFDDKICSDDDTTVRVTSTIDTTMVGMQAGQNRVFGRYNGWDTSRPKPTVLLAAFREEQHTTAEYSTVLCTLRNTGDVRTNEYMYDELEASCD